MSKNVYIIEDINNSLNIIELNGFGIFLERFFVRKNKFKLQKIILAKDIIIKDYINEVLFCDNSRTINNNENYNYRFSSFVSTFFSNYYAAEFKKELVKANKRLDTANVGYYDFICEHNIHNLVSYIYSFNLEMNLKSKKILNLETRNMLKEKNFVFMYELLFSIFENQDPILVKNEIIDYSKINSFEQFINKIFELTKNIELMEYKLEKFNFLSEKHKEKEIVIEKEELPF